MTTWKFLLIKQSKQFCIVNLFITQHQTKNDKLLQQLKHPITLITFLQIIIYYIAVLNPQ